MDADYLKLAYEAWLAGGSVRESRRRCRRFAYGHQWDETIITPDGHTMTEGQYAAMNGQRPMSNNLIRQMVRNLIGCFRSNPQYDVWPDGLMKDTAELNMLAELDSRLLEEFLISGCAIQRVTYEKRIGGTGVWVDNVSPDRFFVNPFTDPRGHDIEIVGMLHDMSLKEVEVRFGHRFAPGEIERIYANMELNPEIAGDFYAGSGGKCRVIEVWTLEVRQAVRCYDPLSATGFIAPRSERRALRRIDAARRAKGKPRIHTRDYTTLRWRGRFYTPSGLLLDEMDSPYGHQLHPFAVKYYPLNDGEVHSCVEDVIDQQRYVNRLVTLLDHILGVSAKGVLLFPLDAKPDDMSWDDVADIWCDCRGILPYRQSTYGNAMPQQIIAPGGSAGASELLKLQMDMFKQISGVHGALQGQTSTGLTSASLFEAQSRNAMLSLHDLFESFESFRRARNQLIMTT